jgi:RNA polymerase I-associated factor PAF67
MANKSPRCREGELRLYYNVHPFDRTLPTIREEGLPAFEELFLYACPKFISANPPPYHDPALLSTYLATPPPSLEPAQHHLSLFLSDVRGQLAVPTLRSFLKLYTSLDAKKLAGFLDKDEEDVVQEMMVMKQCSRSVSRVVGGEKTGNDNQNENGAAGGLLHGQTISTSDLDFVINEVCLFMHPVFRSVEMLKLYAQEYGSYCRIDCGAPICRMVYQEHRTCAACARCLACQPSSHLERWGANWRWCDECAVNKHFSQACVGFCKESGGGRLICLCIDDTVPSRDNVTIC